MMIFVCGKPYLTNGTFRRNSRKTTVLKDFISFLSLICNLFICLLFAIFSTVCYGLSGEKNTIHEAMLQGLLKAELSLEI